MERTALLSPSRPRHLKAGPWSSRRRAWLLHQHLAAAAGRAAVAWLQKQVGLLWLGAGLRLDFEAAACRTTSMSPLASWKRRGCSGAPVSRQTEAPAEREACTVSVESLEMSVSSLVAIQSTCSLLAI